ncbi:hypothetical protein [Robertmurraya korlensis]|uniref:hypothetical protein n=1 Tax=Robertmurraya korlensis TaxID=519977 RepID=UPI00082582B8|nr:hypothetical protein [Robertmurraya korlensis]
MTTTTQPLWKKITAVVLLVLGLLGLFTGRTELGLIAFQVIIFIACLDWAMKYRVSGKQSKFFSVMSIMLGILIVINLIYTLF